MCSVRDFKKITRSVQTRIKAEDRVPFQPVLVSDPKALKNQIVSSYGLGERRKKNCNTGLQFARTKPAALLTALWQKLVPGGLQGQCKDGCPTNTIPWKQAGVQWRWPPLCKIERLKVILGSLKSHRKIFCSASRKTRRCSKSSATQTGIPSAVHGWRHLVDRSARSLQPQKTMAWSVPLHALTY